MKIQNKNKRHPVIPLVRSRGKACPQNETMNLQKKTRKSQEKLGQKMMNRKKESSSTTPLRFIIFETNKCSCIQEIYCMNLNNRMFESQFPTKDDESHVKMIIGQKNDKSQHTPHPSKQKKQKNSKSKMLLRRFGRFPKVCNNASRGKEP